LPPCGLFPLIQVGSLPPDLFNLLDDSHEKVLLLNGAKKFAHPTATTTPLLHDAALALLDRGGIDVKVTHIDAGYDVAEEVAKFLWADVIIYQMPGWWMGAPWIVKKYIDEVFTEGHGSLYASDGRTRSDASQKYGSGGLIQGNTCCR
jgi:modulator of drug activity B